MKITPATLRRLMAVLSLNGLQGRRHAIVWEATQHRPDGGVESAKELSESEARMIIDHYNEKSNKIRRKMIVFAKKMNWGSNTDQFLSALDKFCLERTKFKKHLMKLSISQLSEVLTVIEQKVYPDYLQSLNK